jgi:hypothetical protein
MLMGSYLVFCEFGIMHVLGGRQSDSELVLGKLTLYQCFLTLPSVLDGNALPD